jgi:hypothetical protein
MGADRRHPKFALLGLASLVATAAAACSPSYENGVTLCSMDKRECPSGWTCDVNGVCHESKASADDAAPRDPGGSLDGAAERTPDVALDAAPDVAAGCTPAAPVACPATGTCLRSGYSCASVNICGMQPNVQVLACTSPDQLADCVGECPAAATCNAVPTADACQRCIVQKCCSLVIKCAADTTCETGQMGPLWNELLACSGASCTTICNMP